MPLHDDDTGGPLTALSYSEQGAHLQRGELILVEHLDLDAGAREIAHALGELDRPQDVGGLVDEIAREKHALGHRLAGREGLGGRVRLGTVDRKPAEGVAWLLLGAVLRLAGG